MGCFRMLLIIYSFFAAVSAVVVEGWCVESARTVQDKWRTADAVYAAGMRARGHAVQPPAHLFYWQREYQWRYTWFEGRHVTDMYGYNFPKFDREHAKLSEEGLVCEVDTQARIAALVDHDLEGCVDFVLRRRINSNNQVLKEEPVYNVIDLYPPGGPTLMNFYAPFLLTTGRGFSVFVDVFEEVSSTPDGKGLMVKAVGRFSSKDITGRWELVLDPDAAYMVRKAEFHNPHFDKPYVVMENFDIQRSGDCFFPRRGKFVVGGDEVWEVWYEEVALEKDEPLYQEVRGYLTGNVPNSLVTDRRTGEVFTISEEGKVRGRGESRAEPVGRPLGRASGYVLVLVVNLAIIGLLLLVIPWWRKRRRAGTGG
ncbi:MAG: hypothetical protein KatS3mg110_1647 [Pirellulaceae bacterium]|nr:MAG: hypothetical protein KatS3mg110_1647 [Pirellulaceae bacterium]